MPTDSRNDTADVRPLDPREFEQIRRLAYDTFGLDLRDGKQELVSARLRRLVRAGGFHSYQEYYRHILADRTQTGLAAMIDALTTNHTSFLREPEHFRYLKETVAPQLAGHGRIDVWSAACATGEEVWSLVFLLDEALAGQGVRVLGTDISNRALTQARLAQYPAERVAVLPRHWHSRYLERLSGERQGWYRVAAPYRACAEFRRLNLMEPFAWPRPFPVVFCRNVMIYFDKPTQEKVVAKLAAAVAPGGYLFVGHAERLTGVRHALEYQRPAVYRKPAERLRK
jgi:chemotaxis protein methyltransferase CheR